MPLGYAELEKFYEGLVTRARAQGITCAITSGMACVAYGVAQTTKDCDLLCLPDAAERLLNLLSQTRVAEALPAYRGHITPPLDARWLAGGWTSHLVWHAADEFYLDVFGAAPRASSRWEAELQGFYASPHIVAEMKRTDRDKDWPFATALGVQLLERGDERGWLHIFSRDVLIEVARRVPCPPRIIALRPALRLLQEDRDKLEMALHGERMFWQRLDRVRMRVYERAVRQYMLAVKKDPRSKAPTLSVQHRARVDHAEELLPRHPLKDFGIDRLLSEARQKAADFVKPGSLDWLPNLSEHFVGLLQ